MESRHDGHGERGERGGRRGYDAGRAALDEAAREVARRAHALAWQAFLASRGQSDWPYEVTNVKSIENAWHRLYVSVVLLLVDLLPETRGQEDGGKRDGGK